MLFECPKTKVPEIIQKLNKLFPHYKFKNLNRKDTHDSQDIFESPNKNRPLRSLKFQIYIVDHFLMGHYDYFWKYLYETPIEQLKTLKYLIDQSGYDIETPAEETEILDYLAGK